MASTRNSFHVGRQNLESDIENLSFYFRLSQIIKPLKTYHHIIDIHVCLQSFINTEMLANMIENLILLF